MTVTHCHVTTSLSLFNVINSKHTMSLSLSLHIITVPDLHTVIVPVTTHCHCSRDYTLSPSLLPHLHHALLHLGGIVLQDQLHGFSQPTLIQPNQARLVEKLRDPWQKDTSRSKVKIATQRVDMETSIE